MAMSRLLGTVSSFVLTAVFAVSGAAAQGASKIGVASAVKNRVEAGTRTLNAGSDVFQREVVRTGAESTAQLLFLDETSLSIGPNAEVTLDRFVFNPRGAGNMTVNATKGALRFVSGSQAPSSYQIRTPVATIGVRGTIFDAFVGQITRQILGLLPSNVANQVAPGQTFVIVILVEGALNVLYQGQSLNLSEKGKALIFLPGQAPQLVTWDGSLQYASNNGPSHPLFGFILQGDYWRHYTADGKVDLKDMLDGLNRPPRGDGCCC